MIEVLGQAAMTGGILPLVMSLIKDVGMAWPSQVKRLVAFVLAGAAAIVTIGTNIDYGWDDVGNVNLLAGVWAFVYATMQTTYAGFWKDTRLESGLAASLIRDPHDDFFEVDESGAEVDESGATE